jgi:hypothetical protein
VFEQSIAPTLAHWGARDGSLEQRIDNALDVMANESESALASRIVAALVEIAPRMTRVHHPERLTPDAIRRWVHALEPADYERLSGCNDSVLRQYAGI